MTHVSGEQLKKVGITQNETLKKLMFNYSDDESDSGAAASKKENA